MKIKTPLFFFSFFFFSLLMLSCNDDDVVEVINRLEAKAGENQSVTVNSPVILDGSASRDGNDKSFSFRWTMVTKPQNSAAALTGSFSASTSFTPDQAGVYVLKLTISQDRLTDSDEVVITATTADPEPVPGPLVLEGEVTSDKILENIFEDPAIPDYIVSDDLVVKARLTVDPGVVIEFEQDKSLQIFPQGILVARGTASERVFFTGAEKTKGSWKGVWLMSNSDENELEHVLVEYGGGPEVGMDYSANVVLVGDGLSGAAIKISNSSFWESAAHGVYVAGKSQLNHFSANYFNNNAESAIYVPAAQVHKLDFFTHYTGENGFNGVETGGVVNLENEVTWSYFNDGSRYLVSDNIEIESGVTISEGAAFEFAQDVHLRVAEEGYLRVTGSDFKTVSFTARDQAAYWKGLIYASGHAENQLRYAVISHAGSGIINEVNERANLAISSSAKVVVVNSVFEKGLGWGIVALTGSHYNADITTANLFDNLAAGFFKLPSEPDDEAVLIGRWVDGHSFQNDLLDIREDFYDRINNLWFGGAEDPWDMEPASGFGLHIKEDGRYVWVIAERSPSTGECTSYSAEYILGNVESAEGKLLFSENFWRSRFTTSCDPAQNVDINVEPGSMTLRYELNKQYNLFTGAWFWELKLINPDGSSFSYYRHPDPVL